MLNTTGERPIQNGILPSYRYASYRVGQQILHRIKVTGPIGRAERLPLYAALLKINESDRFFCILDNSANFENIFSIDDIRLMARIVKDAGIVHFYGVTVTPDPAYVGVVRLAEANMEVFELDGELFTTATMKEAEQFIEERMGELETHPAG